MSLCLLNEALDNSETAVDVDTPTLTDVTRPNMILVDDELMDVTAGTSTLTVVRGSHGTTPSTHTDDTEVFEVLTVVPRSDSLLVYYIDDSLFTAAKRIVVSGDETKQLNFTPPAPLTDSTTGVAGATLIAIRTDTIANAVADIRVCIASLNAQLNALSTAVDNATSV